MAKTETSFEYETLVRYMLPQGMLDYFDVTDVREEIINRKDEAGSTVHILHIYLDERDLRDKAWHDLKPNGFTEPRHIDDFPMRGRKVQLHVRRRRWTDANGRNVILDSPSLVAKGTSYSVEFAECLKKIYGHLSGDSTKRGASKPDRW